jgi:hypothetical protein
MNKQPRALRLADAIDKAIRPEASLPLGDWARSAAELRRLHEENTALRQAIAEAEKEATLQEITDIGQEIEQEPESWMGVSDNPYCDDVDCNDPNGRAMRWHNKLLELRKQVALDGLAETSREIEQEPVGEVLNIQWMSNTGGWLIGFHSKRRLYKGDKLYVEPVRCVMVGVCLSKRKIN